MYRVNPLHIGELITTVVEEGDTVMMYGVNPLHIGELISTGDWKYGEMV